MRFTMSLVIAFFVMPVAANSGSECRPTLAPRATGPQIEDEEFNPEIPNPAFEEGKGPTILIDEAHGNFHTADGRYAPVARLLRRDGFVVEASRDSFSVDSLAKARVLIIANALAEQNLEEWTLPTVSAFAEEEIHAVDEWVSNGGSLLLIADHMPFPGAAASLAESFGVLFTNGYATDSTCSEDEFLFDRSNALLGDHPVTRGRDQSERIEAVRSITGQAFRATVPVQPLLRLDHGSVILMPSEAWEFSASTPQVPGDGMLQGAVLSHGRGRVAMFGEAAMFSAQVSGEERRPMGMNMPSARENPQFLLNVMHWLVGLLPED